MTSSDHDLAATLAALSGRLAERLRPNRGRWRPELFGKAVDRRSHRFLVDALRRHRPGDAVLSEEGADSPGRLAADRVWIVDPLDGTREYAEGRPDWAVHVALWAGGELRAGAVAIPGWGITFSTGRALRTPPLRGRLFPLIAVSRTRPPPEAVLVAEATGGHLLPMGSAGVKTAAVLLGEADAYVHAGGQYEWDSAAPAAVARAAGLHVSRLDGTPLRYNQPDPYLPDLLICRPELARSIIAAVKSRAADHDPAVAAAAGAQT